MSDIHINRAGQNLGIFTETEVQGGLDGGRFLGTDLAWRTGMENWKPLAQWADFTVPVGVPPVIGSDAAAPGLPPVLAGELNLPSWEQKSELGVFTAFASTVKEVLVEPSATFSRMKETGGFMTPFIYMVIATLLGTALAFAVQFGMQAVMGSAVASQNPQFAQIMAAQGLGLGTGVVVLLVVLPILLFVGSFLNGGLWHLSLMVLGGANKPFESTYRVYCYVSGSSALVSLVPCCGGFASVIWTIVSGSIGLSKVHGISTGKAVLAVLLPMLVCCSLCGVGFYFLYQSLLGNPDFMEAVKGFQTS